MKLGRKLIRANSVIFVDSAKIMGAASQLLFFDTFSHELVDELNLDLVQFPSPVIVDEVRVIPLNALVQANFPGGMSMRMGATNPTRFRLEFYVNDLTKPGVSPQPGLSG